MTDQTTPATYEPREFSLIAILFATLRKLIVAAVERRQLARMNYATPAWDELKQRGYSIEGYKGMFRVYNEFGQKCGKPYRMREDLLRDLEAWAELELDRIGE